MPGEAEARAGQSVEDWACIPFVSVAAQAIRSQGVDENEQNVDVTALAQLANVVRAAQGSRIYRRRPAIDSVDHSQKKGRDNGRTGNQPRPALIENAVGHSRDLSASLPAQTTFHPIVRRLYCAHESPRSGDDEVAIIDVDLTDHCAVFHLSMFRTSRMWVF